MDSISFKFPFMLYAHFESILKPVDEPYRDRMNTMKTDRKGKASYTEKINTHVPSGWCVHSTFVTRKGLCGKVCRIHKRRGKEVV